MSSTRCYVIEIIQAENRWAGKLDEGDWHCLQRYVKKRETKRVAHHFSSTRVKLQPTAIANGNVPKGEFRRKKNKKVLHALDKAFLDKLDAFSGRILVISDSYIFLSIEKQ